MMAESEREVRDPRYQQTIGRPTPAGPSIRQGDSSIDAMIARLDRLKKGEHPYQKFVQRNSVLARFAKKSGEDIRIGLTNFVKSTLGVEKAGSTQEELILANNMRKHGMHKEADEMLQEIEDRRIENMTERELEDQFSPTSTAERTRRAVTQGIGEIAPAIYLGRLAGTKKLAGSAMKNFMAENAMESFAFTSLRHNYSDPVAPLPEEFFNDFKWVFPMGVGMKVGGAILSEAGAAFKQLLSSAQKMRVQLSPQDVQRGLSGQADEVFDSVMRQLSPDQQYALRQEFKNSAGLREGREIFKKGGQEGRPGMDFPSEPPKVPPEGGGGFDNVASAKKILSDVGEGADTVADGAKAVAKRTIPRSDVVKQEFRMDKLNLLPKDESKVQAVIEALGLSTRTVEHFDEWQEIASQLGTDPEKLVRGIMKNGIDSAPQVLALRDTINSAVHYLSNKSAMIEDAVTPAQKAALDVRILETEKLLDTAIKQLTTEGTNLGRSVVAYRLIARNNLDPAYWLKEAQKVLGEESITEDLRTAITSLIRQEDRIGLAHLVAGLKESTPVEKLITLWKAGLLTGPTTHLANGLSNVTMQSLETVKDVPATVIDWGVSKVTGKRTKAITLQGLVKQVKGAYEGTGTAIDYLRTGIDRDSTLTKYDIPRNVKFNNAYVQMYVDTIFRSLGAVDKVSRFAVLKKSLYEQAYVKEINLTPAARATYLDELSQVLGERATRKDLVESFFKNPDKEMSQIAINDAEFTTFTKDNQFAKGVRLAKQGGPVVKVALDISMPFVKTPTNVAMAIAEYSPGGFLMAAAKGIKGKGQREIVESLSRGITGTAVMALGAALARDGLVTSSLPADKRERELWKANGIQQQSIFLWGKWRRLDRMSPLGNLLAIGAEFNRFGKDKTLGDRFTQAAFGGLKGLTEQSFLKGLSGMTRAIVEPERYAEAFIDNSVGSLVPSILGRIAQGLDTKQRDTDDLLEVIQARIPILAELLPASIDPFGREIKNRQGFFTRVLDPLNSTGPTGDPVAGELFKLNHPISSPNKGLYNPDEYRMLLTMRGKIMNPLLYATMSSNQWQTFTSDQKTYAVDVMVAASSKAANDYMKQVLSQRLAKELMALPPENRDIRFKEIKDKDGTAAMMIQQFLFPQE